MEKRLNSSHYVVFGLVLLVLVIGIISVVKAPANDFVGHNLNSIVGANGVLVDSDNNGIIDKSHALEANDGTLISAELAPNNNVLLKSNKNIVVNNVGSPLFRINDDCVMYYNEQRQDNWPLEQYQENPCTIEPYIYWDGKLATFLKEGSQFGDIDICCNTKTPFSDSIQV